MVILEEKIMTIQWLICQEPVHIGGADSDSRGNNNPIYRLPDRTPTIPGSSLRGALREDAKNSDDYQQYVNEWFGGDNKETNPNFGHISLGWGWVLWFPVHVLGFGNWWVSCPKWLNYYQRLNQENVFNFTASQVYSTDATLANQNVYLRWLKLDNIQHYDTHQPSLPAPNIVPSDRRLIVPDESINLFVDMGLVRQPRVSLLDEPNDKGSLVDNLFSVEGLPPAAVFYFAWTTRKQVNNLSEWNKFLIGEHYLGGLWSVGYGRIEIQ